MSQAGRAAHAHNQARHAQREFGHTKPTLQPVGSDTLWMSEFISSIQGLEGYFNADSIIAAQLGSTRDERIEKLRKLSAHGTLHMSAHREDGVFVEFRWELTDLGRLAC